MSYPRYTESKESGIEWIGTVPAHWNVVSIKWLSPVLRGASPRPIENPEYFDDGGEYAWVRIADATASDGILLETTQRLSELGSSLSVKLQPNTLFVSIAGTVGKPCITGIKSCIHDGFVHFPSLRIDQRFLFRIFEAGVCYGGLGKMGTQLNLNTDSIGSIRIPVPPENELKAILIFLEHELFKIDELAKAFDGLISLLKEKRQAIISHAVTKGLDPSVSMKDSGIEWLGKVPAHWQVKKVKHIASRISSGKTPSGGSETYIDAGVTFLRSQNVYDDGLRLDDVAYISDEVDKSMESSRVISGDILLNITGASIGRTCVVPDGFPPANVNQHVCAIRLKNSKETPFFTWYFKSDCTKKQIDFIQNGAAREGLNFEQIGQFSIPIPTTDEQSAISKYITFVVGKLDALISETLNSISLLQERRTALISAAVTGKIDVRGLVNVVEQEKILESA